MIRLRLLAGPACLLRGIRFVTGTAAAHLSPRYLARGAWHQLERLYCRRPWLWVLNIAEKRARRRAGMPRRHPERIAYFYRKAPWNALQRQLWPSGEYVRYIEADMRERGWRLP